MLTFNSNGKFVRNWVTGYDDNITISSTDSGTYTIFDQNKITFHITYRDCEEEPNVDLHYTEEFEIDEYGGSVIFKDNHSSITFIKIK
jgi:hypothetical protein